MTLGHEPPASALSVLVKHRVTTRTHPGHSCHQTHHGNLTECRVFQVPYNSTEHLGPLTEPPPSGSGQGLKIQSKNTTKGKSTVKFLRDSRMNTHTNTAMPSRVYLAETHAKITTNTKLTTDIIMPTKVPAQIHGEITEYKISTHDERWAQHPCITAVHNEADTNSFQLLMATRHQDITQFHGT